MPAHFSKQGGLVHPALFSKQSGLVRLGPPWPICPPYLGMPDNPEALTFFLEHDSANDFVVISAFVFRFYLPYALKLTAV